MAHSGLSHSPSLRLGPPMTEWAASAAEVAEWCVAHVGGPVKVTQSKVRPWAVVWQVDTSDGTWWAKQNCPGQAFEAGLVHVLSRIAPAYVLPVTATAPERGLLLTPDQGPVFAESVADDDLDAWTRLVQRAMELSRLAEGHGSELLATGLSGCRVPDRLAPTVRVLEEDVAVLGLPDALVHNDLHEHNAFDRPEGLRFFDFADAVWSHPLSGLLVPLNVLRARLDAPGPDDARLRRVADAGLEVWTDEASLAELRRALPAALRLGCLGRAESWARIEPHLASGDLEEYGGAADAWWNRVSEPSPVLFP